MNPAAAGMGSRASRHPTVVVDCMIVPLHRSSIPTLPAYVMLNLNTDSCKSKPSQMMKSMELNVNDRGSEWLGSCAVKGGWYSAIWALNTPTAWKERGSDDKVKWQFYRYLCVHELWRRVQSQKVAERQTKLNVACIGGLRWFYVIFIELLAIQLIWSMQTSHVTIWKTWCPTAPYQKFSNV